MYEGSWICILSFMTFPLSMRVLIWVLEKLSKLDDIYTTIKRLKSSLDNLGIKQMNSIYDKILN